LAPQDLNRGRIVDLVCEAHRRATRKPCAGLHHVQPVLLKPTEWQPERTVLVTTRLDNAAGLLKPDMTGTAKIYCGSQRVIDLVTRRLARFIRVEFWSWW
jgi:hypothetical protein